MRPDTGSSPLQSFATLLNILAFHTNEGESYSSSNWNVILDPDTDFFEPDTDHDPDALRIIGLR